jgi:hypothetical protein
MNDIWPLQEGVLAGGLTVLFVEKCAEYCKDNLIPEFFSTSRYAEVMEFLEHTTR